MQQRKANTYGTRLMAWGPLSQGAPDLQSSPVLKALADMYGKAMTGSSIN